MKVIICDKYNSLDHLKIVDKDIPWVNEKQICIQVMASTVASGDAVVRNAANPFVRLVFGIRKPRNPILGTDLAGVVITVGSKVKRFQIGDLVIASTGMKFGAHAQYVVLHQNAALAKIPENMPFVEAASLVFGGTAALHYLRQMPLNSSGQTSLLIYGASGAVGSSTVQVATHMGYTVTAVAGSSNQDLVRNLGVTTVLDYQADHWQQALGKYDYIFDAAGKTDKAFWGDYLTSTGRYFTIAKGLVKAKSADLELLVDLASQGKLRPVIDSVYPMEQVREAYKRVESGRKRGNVVLEFEEADI